MTAGIVRLCIIVISRAAYAANDSKRAEEPPEHHGSGGFILFRADGVEVYHFRNQLKPEYIFTRSFGKNKTMLPIMTYNKNRTPDDSAVMMT